MTNPMTEFVQDERLIAYVERIEAVQETKDAATEDIKALYNEANNVGYEPKIIRKVIKWRGEANPERDEAEAIFEMYRDSVGEK